MTTYFDIKCLIGEDGKLRGMPYGCADCETYDDADLEVLHKKLKLYQGAWLCQDCINGGKGLSQVLGKLSPTQTAIMALPGGHDINELMDKLGEAGFLIYGLNFRRTLHRLRERGLVDLREDGVYVLNEEELLAKFEKTSRGRMLKTRFMPVKKMSTSR